MNRVRIFDRLGSAEAPTVTRRSIGRAVVLGGSIAGLLAARVLADHAESVVVVERDELGEGVQARPGVPQAEQVHVLLPGGRVQLDRWFAGFSEEAVAAGAVLAEPERVHLYFNGRRKVTTPGAEFLMGSRPFLESLIRRRTTDLPRVTTAHGRATGIELDGDRVAAVRVAAGTGDRKATLAADVVVDAMGRSSRLGDWLELGGWPKPPMQRMNIELNYTTAYFRRSDPAPPVLAAVSMWADGRMPPDVAPAALCAIEDDRWMIMFGGYGADRPGRTPEEIRRICAALPPEFGSAVAGELIGDVRPYRQADSRRRDYHRLERLPAGLVSVGDAVASFNPVYGQGMSSAALHASCLSEYLRSGPDLSAPARAFFALQRVVVDAAWQTSASPDLALPHIDGPYPRGYQLGRRLGDQIIAASVTDTEVARRFTAVTTMRAHPSTLVTPGTLLRAVRANLKDRWSAGAHAQVE